jgi:hypothetical protein
MSGRPASDHVLGDVLQLGDHTGLRRRGGGEERFLGRLVHLFRRQPTAAFALLVDALRWRG